jgi:SAM-dependent methyltransferase
MNTACRICDHRGEAQGYVCKERMFGWGDEFPYFQCQRCSCLQIASLPSDLGRFYPANYQSYRHQSVPQHGWKSYLAGLRDRVAATSTGLAGKFVRRFGSDRSDLNALAQVPARREMRILDVGCGGGQLLAVLRRAGFRNLAGIDPFLPGDVEVLPGLIVRKQSLDQVEGEFDLIMLHHVFEHLPSGQEILGFCRQRLSREGKVLLRFPVADSDAWEEYRECWVQLDAPRHLFLHTRSSFQLLAGKAGLKIEKWFCDSSAFQFQGSELYRKGQPLFDRTGAATRVETFFTSQEMDAFADRARKLNAAGRGDQVVAILSAEK